MKVVSDKVEKLKPIDHKCTAAIKLQIIVFHVFLLRVPLCLMTELNRKFSLNSFH